MRQHQALWFPFSRSVSSTLPHLCSSPLLSSIEPQPYLPELLIEHFLLPVYRALHRFMEKKNHPSPFIAHNQSQ